MVICNIVVGELSQSDQDELSKYLDCPSIKIVNDITWLDTSVPTIFYGYKVATKWCGDFNRKSKQINDSYWWTYSNEEIKFENWIHNFIKDCENKYFNFIDNGIDIIFDSNSLKKLLKNLNKFPLIHEGEHEIYIANWREKSIEISSIKKETLEYAGIPAHDFLLGLYNKLDYKFLSLEAKRFNLLNDKLPLFLDELLYANSNEWVGIKEIISHFSTVKINRKMVLAYYLKRSEYLRPKFELYL